MTCQRVAVSLRELKLIEQDFYEVDDNVTRNIPWELRQDDWNGMVLHYLGLDHIGHKSGPARYLKPHGSVSHPTMTADKC